MPRIAFRWPTFRPQGATAVTALLLFGILAAPASAASERVVHWAAGPTVSPTGQTLPPAVAYEVWMSLDNGPESLVASVPETTCTITVPSGATCVVRVRGICAEGIRSAFSEYSDPWRAPEVAAAPPLPPLPLVLGPASPNPFNGRTTIACELPSTVTGAAEPRLAIHDLRGRRLRSLAVVAAPGRQQIDWDGRDAAGRLVPAGVYLARLICGAEQVAIKLTFVP